MSYSLDFKRSHLGSKHISHLLSYLQVVMGTHGHITDLLLGILLSGW